MQVTVTITYDTDTKQLGLEATTADSALIGTILLAAAEGYPAPSASQGPENPPPTS
jgi:hypothetical protein